MNAFENYQAALSAIAKLGREQQVGETAVQSELDAALAAAHELPRRAVKQTEAAKNRINQQQTRGREALGRIGQEELLPARVRPAKATSDVTADQLDRAVAMHATAIARLEAAVRTYERAVRGEAAQRQAEAQREAEERSRRRAAEEEARKRRVVEEEEERKRRAVRDEGVRRQAEAQREAEERSRRRAAEEKESKRRAADERLLERRARVGQSVAEAAELRRKQTTQAVIALGIFVLILFLSRIVTG